MVFTNSMLDRIARRELQVQQLKLANQERNLDKRIKAFLGRDNCGWGLKAQTAATTSHRKAPATPLRTRPKNGKTHP